MSTRRIVLLIILGSTLVRLVLAGMTGLGYDESYMLGNARQFLPSYVDQVPMHLWMAGVARRVFASEASIYVRLPFILAFAGSTWLMYRLSERLFGARAGLWAVIALNLAPVFTLAHASWLLADGPLIFFLLATANVVARILFDQPAPPRPTLWWIAAGALGGLALLSKYHAALFLLAVFVYLLTVPAARRHLTTPGPWLGALAAVAVFSPVILWNLDNAFVGVAFQTVRMANPELNFRTLAIDFGGQLLYLTPWLSFPFLWSLLTALGRGPRDPRGWYIGLAAVWPIAVFTSAALLAKGFPHWAMPGWLFTIPLFGREIAALEGRRPALARGYMAIVAGLFVAVLAAFLVQYTRGGLVPRSIVAENPMADPTIDLIDWRELRDALEARGLLTPDAVFASPLWMYAGKVSYALGPDVPVVCVCADAQHFPYRYDQSQWNGRDVVVIVPRNFGSLWEVAAGFFDSLTPVEPVAITRNGETVLTLDLKMGKNLRYPLK